MNARTETSAFAFRITIRSLLDSRPYLHEPHQRDNPAFNDYVRYNTWRWLLLDYLDTERDPDFKAFFQHYLRQHGAEMIAELERQKLAHGGGRELTSPYKRGARPQKPDYNTLLLDLRSLVAQHAQPPAQSQVSQTDERKRKASNEAP